MKEAIEQIQQELAGLKAATQKEVEEARVRFLGKKGCFSRNASVELVKELGVNGN